VVVQVVVVVPVPPISRVMVAVEPSYEFPRPDCKVIVIVEENETPGFSDAGIGPLVAENPLVDGVTEKTSVERLAGMFPVFSTV